MWHTCVCPATHKHITQFCMCVRVCVHVNINTRCHQPIVDSHQYNFASEPHKSHQINTMRSDIIASDKVIVYVRARTNLPQAAKAHIYVVCHQQPSTVVTTGTLHIATCGNMLCLSAYTVCAHTPV